MLRHDCGYKLAHEGRDTRAVPHYLGHENVQHTFVSPERFKSFWEHRAGPNPGGPGLTPYTSGQQTPPAPMAESTSAMPPKHHAHHAKTAAHHRGKAPQLTGGTANQLNQEELARLQAGNFSNPPVEPSNPLPPSPAPTSGGRMSTGGRATSAAPTH
jgi:hypothetical protein